MVEKNDKVRRAVKILEALEKIKKWNESILVSPKGVLGVIYDERTEEHDGVLRRVYYVVTKERKLDKTFADYWNPGMLSPDDCRPFVIDDPITVTSRVTLGLTDSDDAFNWILLADRAERYVAYKHDNLRYQELVYELNDRLENLNRALERETNKVKMYAEYVRDLEEKVSRLSREVLNYKDTYLTLREKLKEYMVLGYVNEEGIRYLMSIVDKLGLYRVAGAKDHLVEILDEEKMIQEKLSLTYGTRSDGRIREEIAELRKENAELKRMVHELMNRLDEMGRREGKKKVEAEAAEVVVE